MKRYPGMKLMRGVLFGLVLLAAACGGERSVASKSAAAYDEAKAKGVAVTGGHEHGGHEAGPATDADHSAHGTTADMHAGHDMTGGDMAAMDHSAHGTTGDAHAGHDMAAMDHAAMNNGTAANAHAGHQMQGGMKMDHSAHAATADAHAGHDMTAMDHAAMGHDMSASNAHAQHGSTSGASGSHAAHDMPGMTAEQHAAMQQGTASTGADAHAGHTQTMTGMAGMDHSQHGATATAATPIAGTAPRSTADVRNLQPSSTLKPDPFDAPAPVSVNEAAKAGQGGGHEGHDMRGITPGEDRENPPTPIPAIRDGSNAKPAPPAHDHHGGH